MSDIFSIKQNEDLKKQIEYYTLKGMQDYLDERDMPRVKEDNGKVLAKKICYYDTDNNLVKQKTRYQIKIGAYGRIYNPIGLYSEGRSNKYSSKTGKDEWRMKEVNENIFNLYLSFLKTKNNAHLIIAERGLQ